MHQKYIAVLIACTIFLIGCSSMHPNAIEKHEAAPITVASHDEADSVIHMWSRNSFEVAKQSELRTSHLDIVLFIGARMALSKDATKQCGSLELKSVQRNQGDTTSKVEVVTADVPGLIWERQERLTLMNGPTWANGEALVDLNAWSRLQGANLEIWNVDTCGTSSQLYLLINK